MELAADQKKPLVPNGQLLEVVTKQGKTEYTVVG